MTMPKFEPVAWRYELKAGEYTFAEKRYLNETYAPRPTAIHTADQLVEAYEAGKREASEDLEQAAFEKWLYDKGPSGDVESVQRQWLKSYEYAEFAGKLEQAAQIDSLQQQLAAALAVCKQKDEALKWLMDWQVKHVDVWDNPAFDNAEEALTIQPDDSALKAWLGKQSSRVKE